MTDNTIDHHRGHSTEGLEDEVIAQLRSLPDVEVPVGLSKQIMAAVHGRKRSWWRTVIFRLSRPRTVSFTPLKWAPVGAALMVGLFIGFNLDRMSTAPEPSPAQQLAQSENDADVHFKLGRLLLANDKAAEALVHLKQAAHAHPDNASYRFWVGVNFWTLNDFDQEREYYQSALTIDPDYLPAHVYLGHNYLDQGDWQTALGHYERVLQDVPDHPEALFNRGVALRYQGDTALENNAWAAYLDHYDRGEKALQAVTYLNANGNFSFRRIQMGPVEVVKRRISFRPDETVLEGTAHHTLEDIGHLFEQNRRLELHVVAYVANDAQLAKLRAKKVKQHLTDQFDGISPQRIKLSWFDVGETIKMDDHVYQLGSSIHVFATTVEES
ncbi:MAG: tetratricopeptide repeat protein [Desulfobacteraceae bacterium]|nr:tetratricopeptide repeat protein [Desulfobacteraceae bacterium]MBC2749737.1 tetratricopeptide repeat protein [Desulfobacteraceae bacterium]